MKVRRYFAEDMAQGLRMVREEQGPDAVIISNKKVDGGFELIAAEDYDEALLKTANNDQKRPRTRPIEEEALAHEVQLKSAQSLESESKTEGLKKVADSPAAVETPVARAPQAPQLIWTHEPMIDQMQQELSSLRGLLEQQISGLAWGDFGQRHPLRASLLRKLTGLGMNAAVSRELVNRIPENLSQQHGWNRLLGLLAEAVPIDSDNILSRGGMFALVGPPGAGKTTLISKLAARHALVHGKDSVALITTDNQRVGAYEQLRSFGRIAGIPVWAASNSMELQQGLEHVYHRRLVLIDTAGIGHKNAMLNQQLELLGESSNILQTALVLPATMQSLALDQLIDAYQPVAPSSCVITHQDEAASLGPVLSVIIDNEIPVSYVSDGQSIPEDIHAAKAHKLIARAVSIYQQQDISIEDAVLEHMFVEENAHAQH